MNYRQILTLRSALLALDGLEHAVEVRGQTQLLKRPFKFSGPTRLKIARNLHAVEAAFENYDAARVGLVREVAGGADQVPPESVPLFSRRLAELLLVAADLPLTPLAEVDLNLDDNEIPPAVLAVLLEHLVETAGK